MCRNCFRESLVLVGFHYFKAGGGGDEQGSCLILLRFYKLMWEFLQPACPSGPSGTDRFGERMAGVNRTSEEDPGSADFLM